MFHLMNKYNLKLIILFNMLHTPNKYFILVLILLLSFLFYHIFQIIILITAPDLLEMMANSLLIPMIWEHILYLLANYNQFILNLRCPFRGKEKLKLFFI